MSNIELLRRIIQRCGPVPVVVVTAIDSAKYTTAVYDAAISVIGSLLFVERSSVPRDLTAKPRHQVATEYLDQVISGDGPVTEPIALLVISHIRYHRRDPYWTAMQAILAGDEDEDNQVD